MARPPGRIPTFKDKNGHEIALFSDNNSADSDRTDISPHTETRQKSPVLLPHGRHGQPATNPAHTTNCQSQWGPDRPCCMPGCTTSGALFMEQCTSCLKWFCDDHAGHNGGYLGNHQHYSKDESALANRNKRKPGSKRQHHEVGIITDPNVRKKGLTTTESTQSSTCPNRIIADPRHHEVGNGTRAGVGKKSLTTPT